MKLIESFPYFGPNRRSEKTLLEQVIRFTDRDLVRIGRHSAAYQQQLLRTLRRAGLLSEQASFPPVPLSSEPMEWLCGLYAQTTLLLQQCCGHDVSEFFVEARTDRKHCLCLIEHEHADVGMTAAKLGLMLMSFRLTDIDRVFQVLHEFASVRTLPRMTAAMIRAARQRGIPATKLDRWPFTKSPYPEIAAADRAVPNGLLMLGFGCRQKIVDGAYCRDLVSQRWDFGRGTEEARHCIQGLGLPFAEPGAEQSGEIAGFWLLVGGDELLAVLTRSGADGMAMIENDQVHPSILASARRIARQLDVPLLLTGLAARNPGRALDGVSEGFCSIDIAPNLDEILPAASGLMDRVAGCLLDQLFKDPQTSRIPLVAVTGTNGKTTTCRMVDHIFRIAGLRTGMVVTDGIYVGNEMVLNKDSTTRTGHLRVLRSGRVEAVTLECCHAGMMGKGLAFDHCDVAVCLNVANDHLGSYELETVEDIARIKQSLLTTASKGVVLNADNEYCREMAGVVTAGRVCLVSVMHSAEQLSRMFPDHDFFCVIEQGNGQEQIVIRDRDQRHRVVAVADIPACYGGKAQFNTYNAQHAIAACYLAGISLAVIQQAMVLFRTGMDTTPARLNIYAGEQYMAILDFAHNADAFENLCRFTDQLEVAGRRMLMLEIAGDRLERDLLKVVAATADHFDHFVCTNTIKSRGRKPGEMSDIIRRGLLQAGVKPGRIDVVENSFEAMDHILGMAGEGDLLVFHADEIEECWNKITSAQRGEPA